MDRPVLHVLAGELAESERLRAFADALPAPARVSEPALPLLLAALHLRLERGLVCALAGYERVERAEERGQFAVRGGIVDVFPTTGREPVRIELFGDEVEAIRAFSPFTQRALHPLEQTAIYPAAERRLDLIEPGEEG